MRNQQFFFSFFSESDGETQQAPSKKARSRPPARPAAATKGSPYENSTGTFGEHFGEPLVHEVVPRAESAASNVEFEVDYVSFADPDWPEETPDASIQEPFVITGKNQQMTYSLMEGTSF